MTTIKPKRSKFENCVVVDKFEELKLTPSQVWKFAKENGAYHESEIRDIVKVKFKGGQPETYSIISLEQFLLKEKYT